MANYYSQYGIYLLSTANYQDGVAFSSVMDDFPFVLGAEVLYDNVSGVQEPAGRHPTTNEPLWRLGYDRHTMTVVTNGVSATSAGVAPPYGDPITICSLTAETTNAGVMADIDLDTDHVIYGVWNLIGDPDDLPPALEDYYIDSVIPESRWDVLEPFALARGVTQTQLDTWRSNNPNATPNDLKSKFENFVQ
mgnify:FL=1